MPTITVTPTDRDNLALAAGLLDAAASRRDLLDARPALDCLLAVDHLLRAGAHLQETHPAPERPVDAIRTALHALSDLTEELRSSPPVRRATDYALWAVMAVE